MTKPLFDPLGEWGLGIVFQTFVIKTVIKMSKLECAYLLNIDLFGIAKSHHPQQNIPHTHTPTHQHHRQHQPSSLHSLYSLYCNFWSVNESKYMAWHYLISSDSLFWVLSMSEITQPKQLIELQEIGLSRENMSQFALLISEEMVSIRVKRLQLIYIIRYEFSLVFWARTYFRPC